MGEQEFVRASCVAPVRMKNLDPCHEDIRRFTRALAGRRVRGFLNAASPGLITAFQPNAYYPSHEAYLADLVSAMRPEYTAIIASGVQLQLDCPDLAMARHTGYQDLSEEQFLKIAAANVEALNAATADIPTEKLRMHVCWGNYEGPHDHDIPLERVLARRPSCSRRPTRAMSTSGRCGRERRFPRTKCSRRASSTRARTASSIPSSSRSVSSASSPSSASSA
jgi:5-methyltetrahydropteroyltriglutamate--homocysteine methyltransferase